MENQNPEVKNSSKKPFVVLAAIVVVAVGSFLTYASGLFKAKSPEQNPSTTETGNSSQLEGTNPNSNQNNMMGGNNMMNGNGDTGSMMQNSKYKDGTYTIEQTYRSPGGDEKFVISITLKNDIVTATAFTPEPVSQIGIRMQGNFDSSYKQEVIGQNIDSISLDAVGGASLTTGGFMKALDSIKIQAQA